MKKLATLTMAIIFLLLLSLSQSQPTRASDCPQPKFHNLNRYKSERWSRVFADPEVLPALRNLLKTDLGLRRRINKANAEARQPIEQLLC